MPLTTFVLVTYDLHNPQFNTELASHLLFDLSCGKPVTNQQKNIGTLTLSKERAGGDACRIRTLQGVGKADNLCGLLLLLQLRLLL